MKTKKKKSTDKKRKRLQVLHDEKAIRSLVARFADACIMADYEEFKSLWSREGIWTIHEPYLASSEGIDEIVEMMRSSRIGRELFVHFGHSGVVKVKGEEATARWVTHEVSKGPGEVYYGNYALYVDFLRKSKGKWKFVQRDYHYLWIDTAVFPGEARPLPQHL